MQKNICPIFAQVFGQSMTNSFRCVIFSFGDSFMRHDKIKRLRDDTELIRSDLEHLERNIATLNDDYERENELRHLARLIYAGKIVEKAGLLYSFNEQILCLFLAQNQTSLQKPSKMV